MKASSITSTTWTSASSTMMQSNVEEQLAITEALLAAERHRTAVIGSQFGVLRDGIEALRQQQERNAYEHESAQRQRLGMESGERRLALRGHSDASSRRREMEGTDSPLRITAANSAAHSHLLSPVNPAVVDAIADDLTTSSWSSEPSLDGSSNSSSWEETSGEEDEEEWSEEDEEDESAEEEEESMLDGQASPSPPRAGPKKSTPLPQPVPFDADAIISSVFANDDADGDRARGVLAAHRLLSDAQLLKAHAVSTLLWDEAQQRTAIAVEEAEVHTILGCYNCRFEVSCNILEHQLLTLVDHIHYHHEALLMQHAHGLEALKGRGLQATEGGRRGARHSPSAAQPSCVNRLL